MLETLIATAATTFVAAMATSAWKTAHNGIVQLYRRFAHGDGARSAENALIEGDQQVGQANDPRVTRERLRGGWEQRVEELLQAHPEARPELEHLLEEIQRALPEAQQQWIQTINANATGSIAAGAIQGNVIIHQPGEATTSGEAGREQP